MREEVREEANPKFWPKFINERPLDMKMTEKFNSPFRWLQILEEEACSV